MGKSVDKLHKFVAHKDGHYYSFANYLRTFERIVKKEANTDDPVAWKEVALQSLPTWFLPTQEAIVDKILEKNPNITHDQLVEKLKKLFRGPSKPALVA